MNRILFLLIASALNSLAQAGPAAPPAAGSPTAASIAAQIRELSLDPEESYRVRDLEFSRHGGRFFLNEGVLIFAKPIAGRRVAAVFSAEVDSGDAELLVIPPTRSERYSMANFTKSPNLNEHFRGMVLIFTDNTGDELFASLSGARDRKLAEEALLLGPQWNPVVRNLAGSFEVRMVEDLLSGATGFFFAAVQGQTLGNIDFYADARLLRDVTVGQLVYRENRSYYDVWAHFSSQSRRQRKNAPAAAPNPAAPQFNVTNCRIQARIRPDLHLDATTTVSLTVDEPMKVLPFEISPRVQVTKALVDGQPAEIWRRESVRSALLTGEGNDVFLVLPQTPLAPGSHEVVFSHDGDVVVPAGNNVYYVASRINWYPRRGLRFAAYELEFRYPKNLSFVASGEPVEEHVEGEERVSRRRSVTPIRFAGFNLGDYVKASATRGGLQVDVYANRQLETSLAPRLPAPLPAPTPSFQRRRVLDLPLPEITPPSTGSRLDKLASDIAREFEWMAAKLGPPPAKTLAVSPIPGQFGQGFPGLVYLSTSSYLDNPPRFGASQAQRVFLTELLHAHETAHQWWGNVVTSAGYEDEWLQEALANYLAVAALEQREGLKAAEEVMAQYKERLLEKQVSGVEVESAGPVTFGTRLNSSQTPGAWRTIVYDKGAWVIHMLRRRMGDAQFWPMLRELVERYRHQSVSTQQFQALAAEFVAKQPLKGSYRELDPNLDQFFETWTASTGIPALKLQWRVTGKAPKLELAGRIEQTDVPEGFSDIVPVEIQAGRGRTIVHWVRTSSEPVEFRVALSAPPAKVTLDPGHAVLRR